MAKLADIKNKQNAGSVDAFVDSIEDEQKRDDTRLLIRIMEKATREKPAMWGKSMIGFGKKVYQSPTSGRQVEWFLIGFSPSKTNFSLHLVTDVNKDAELLQKLGKCKTGSGCIYINKLADVDIKILNKMIVAAAKEKEGR